MWGWWWATQSARWFNEEIVKGQVSEVAKEREQQPTTDSQNHHRVSSRGSSAGRDILPSISSASESCKLYHSRPCPPPPGASPDRVDRTHSLAPVPPPTSPHHRVPPLVSGRNSPGDLCEPLQESVHMRRFCGADPSPFKRRHCVGLTCSRKCACLGACTHPPQLPEAPTTGNTPLPLGSALSSISKGRHLAPTVCAYPLATPLPSCFFVLCVLIKNSHYAVRR